MKRFDERKQRIISIVAESNEAITGKRLSAILGTSLRTLQSEVAQINRVLPLILSDNKGYRVDREQLKELEHSFSNESSNSHTILRKLILTDASYQIDELAEFFYLSTSALEKRLQSYKTVLAANDLKIQRKKNYIYITGSEQNKRKLMNALLFEEIDATFNSIESLSTYFQGIDTVKIQSIILNAIDKFEYFVEKSYAYNLIINIIIALYRMKAGLYIHEVPDDTIRADLPEYPIAKEICDQYALHWGITPADTDIVYVAKLLSGHIKPVRTKETDTSLSKMVTQAFIDEIDSILKQVFHYYMLNINYSEYLYNFSLHVDALIKRAKNEQTAVNDIFESIKRNCPFTYDVAVSIAREIAEKYDIQIPDEEIGYIGVYIGFLIENATEENAKVNTLLLSDDYQHITENIKRGLKENYSELIEIQAITDKYDEKLAHLHVDLIISTKPLHVLGKEIVIISPFFSRKDRLNVEDAIR